MIKINGRTLCESCFEETFGDPCPFCGYSNSTYMSDPMTLTIGSVLNHRYRIGRVIGKGGFGITYAAYDLKMDNLVAVKEYYPMGLAIRAPGDPRVTVSSRDSEVSFRSGAEKFYDEAKMVSQFNGNRNIVSVHDFFYENDTVYFTMGYLKGESLKSYLKSARLMEGQAVSVMQDISNALMVTHSMNILHRDISPDNIMLCDDGTIKLIDFGAARQVVAEQSQSLSVILKQGFAPLEQYQKRGNQGPWTDIYALGSTIYNAITGDILDDPMTRLGDDSDFQSNKHGISENLWTIIRKCVMLNIEDRYQDVFELKKDLNAVGIKAEPVVDAGQELLDFPIGETAKAFESRTADGNATVLLSSNSQTVKSGDNRTVAIAAEKPIEEQTDARESEIPPINNEQTSSKSLLVPVLAVIIAVLAGVVVFLVIKGPGGSDEKADAEVAEQITTESVEEESSNNMDHDEDEDENRSESESDPDDEKETDEKPSDVETETESNTEQERTDEASEEESETENYYEEDENRVEAEYTEIIPNSEIENEVTRIRGMYNDIQAEYKTYPLGKYDWGTWYDGGRYQKAIVNAGYGGADYERWYFYENHELFFSFWYKGSDENRFYFKGNRLFRWIDGKTVYDNRLDMPEWPKWEEKVVTEAYAL